MTATIMIIEDDAALTELLSYNLIAAGFEVISLASGANALDTVVLRRPDLVVVDWMLPGLSGLEITKVLRAGAETHDLPIIMLTARGLPQDKLKAFDAGVDDYIVKPFSVAELMARIESLLRRTYRGRDAATHAIGDLMLDRLAHQARFKNVELILGPTEFRLLEYLIERHGRVLSRAQLIDRVWRGASDVNDRTVDVHIGSLRRTLADAGAPDIIRTVRGAGYMLALEDE